MTGFLDSLPFWGLLLIGLVAGFLVGVAFEYRWPTVRQLPAPAAHDPHGPSAGRTAGAAPAGPAPALPAGMVRLLLVDSADPAAASAVLTAPSVRGRVGVGPLTPPADPDLAALFDRLGRIGDQARRAIEHDPAEPVGSANTARVDVEEDR